MPDTRHPIDPLASDPLDGPRFSPVDLAASVLSLVWVVAVLGYRFTTPEGAGVMVWVMTLLVVVVPLALIWAAASTLRSVGMLRTEAAQLQAAVDAMRDAIGDAQPPGVGYPRAQTRQGGGEPIRPPGQARTDAGGAAPRAGVQPVAMPGRAAAAAPQAAAEEQPGLALGTPPDARRAPIAARDFIRALQFPEDPDDTDGFRSLRAALEDREVARLIRAAQDVLTLLSQENIYMDDLAPDRARPEVWRRFAAGERGRGIASIGGVRDRNALALTAARMREDPVFRDAAHHFLRTFDRSFQAFEKDSSDSDISDLADTRTARAFMLFGRVMGVFD